MLTIGVLNSMPESAVRSTERQFVEILTEAALGIPLDLKWFSLTPRAGYGTVDDLWLIRHVDGMIATGTEPRAGRLQDEPYWPAFARTVDWATQHTTSTIWSCLGAHAAVLHLDDVRRRSYAAKLHGVFAVNKQREHVLVANIEDVWPVPHSRWNTLSAATLRAKGYQILSESEEVSADVFAKTFGNSLFIFLQGHPEYDARALMREYRRDVLRYISGDRNDYPAMPAHYFDILTQRRLTEFSDRVLADRAYDQGMVEFQVVVGKANLDATWKPTAVQLYRNWFGILAAQRQTQDESAAIS